MKKRMKKKFDKVEVNKNFNIYRSKELELDIEYKTVENENTIEILRDNINKVKENKYVKIELINEVLKSQIMLNKKNEELENEVEKLKVQIDTSVANIGKYHELIKQLSIEKINLLDKLFNSYIKEENLLKSFMRFKIKSDILNKKYIALKESKLGKLTLWYWRKKKGGLI